MLDLRGDMEDTGVFFVVGFNGNLTRCTLSDVLSVFGLGR